MKKISLNISKPYPAQIRFFECTARRIAYGGARGGGKSWAARTKAVLLALNYPGLQVLLMRRTLPELRENHINPLLSMLNGTASYKDSTKEFTFPNGSRIKLGYCDNERDVLQYQGQSYDVIFMEEATQFTEFQYTAMTECSRLSGLCKVPFTPRMYFTCNPGGVGHNWVKRLFISRCYERSERPEDHVFIPSSVYDNLFVMQNDPDYVRNLESIPDPARRKAYLDGDWDIFVGQYFEEFKRDIHVIKPFEIPEHWNRYIAFDYGLDMLACYWAAFDTYGRAYIYKEIYKKGLIVSDAAEAIKAAVNEDIQAYYAPPDLWNRHSDTGKSTADWFFEKGIPLIRVSNDRIQGWYNVHEWLKPFKDEQGKEIASVRIFENCANLIENLPAIQRDDKNPEDCAKEPHEVTHAPDAIRYLFSGRPLPTVIPQEPDEDHIEYDDQIESFMNWGK
jgi:phage terminase large subunit